MKKRHIRLAKKLCEAYEQQLNSTGRFRYQLTPWPDVHIFWKRYFYLKAMVMEKIT